jgi:hypothetical protein
LGVLSDEEERRSAHGGRDKRVGGLHLADRFVDAREPAADVLDLELPAATFGYALH